MCTVSPVGYCIYNAGEEIDAFSGQPFGTPDPQHLYGMYVFLCELHTPVHKKLHVVLSVDRKGLCCHCHCPLHCTIRVVIMLVWPGPDTL